MRGGHVGSGAGFGRIHSGKAEEDIREVELELKEGDAGVHQIRVAIRRLHAALTLFRPLLEPHAEKRFSEALRSLGRIFGEARDWDVFCGETLVSAQEHGVAASWLNLLREPAETLRAAAHARVSAEMQAPSMTATVLGLAEWGRPQAQRWIDRSAILRPTCSSEHRIRLMLRGAEA